MAHSCLTQLSPAERVLDTVSIESEAEAHETGSAALSVACSFLFAGFIIFSYFLNVYIPLSPPHSHVAIPFSIFSWYHLGPRLAVACLP